MGTLKIGRVGIETTLIDHRDWTTDSYAGVVRHRISGHMTSTTLAKTQSLRSELIASIGQMVPVVYSGDSTFDGFYFLEDATVEARHGLGSLQGVGLFEWSAVLAEIGSEAQVEHQSLLTGALKANAHGLIVGEVHFWHSPPYGALNYDGGRTGTPTAWTRATADGAIPVILDLATTVDPKWSSPPSTYYSGGCYVSINSVVRAGLSAPNTPLVWEIGNKLTKVTPGANGRIVVSHWTGAAYESVTYNIKFATTTVIPLWHYVTIVKNTAEVVVIELTRDAQESPATTSRHVLTLTLRRGSLFVEGYFTWTGTATTWSLDRDATEASTAITPTGAATAVALRATGNDANGNRYVMGSSLATTKDTTLGGLDFASTKTFDFFIGCEIDGTSAAANDQAADQCLQYMATFNETVRAVRR